LFSRFDPCFIPMPYKEKSVKDNLARISNEKFANSFHERKPRRGAGKFIDLIGKNPDFGNVFADDEKIVLVLIGYKFDNSRPILEWLYNQRMISKPVFCGDKLAYDKLSKASKKDIKENGGGILSKKYNSNFCENPETFKNALGFLKEHNKLSKVDYVVIGDLLPWGGGDSIDNSVDFIVKNYPELGKPIVIAKRYENKLSYNFNKTIFTNIQTDVKEFFREQKIRKIQQVK